MKYLNLAVLLFFTQLSHANNSKLDLKEKIDLVKTICMSPNGGCAGNGLFSISEGDSELEIIYQSCSNHGLGNDEYFCYRKASDVSENLIYQNIVSRCSKKFDKDAPYQWSSWYICIENKLELIFKS